MPKKNVMEIEQELGEEIAISYECFDCGWHGIDEDIANDLCPDCGGHNIEKSSF